MNSLEYNTERKKLIIPEYGRHIHQMIDQAVLVEDKIERNARAEPPSVVITITFLLSYKSEKYPIGPCPTTPEIVAINKRIDVSRSVNPA